MLKKAFRSPHPALNVYCFNKDVSCDIVYSEVPAIFDGSTTAIIFFGNSSKVMDVHGIKRDNQFANTLEDTIIQQGAPNRLLSDRGKLSLAIKSKISYEHFVLIGGKENHTSTTRILRNDGTRPWGTRTLMVTLLTICLLLIESYV
jgi:hypothetical protein